MVWESAEPKDRDQVTEEQDEITKEQDEITKEQNAKKLILASGKAMKPPA